MIESLVVFEAKELAETETVPVKPDYCAKVVGGASYAKQSLGCHGSSLLKLSFEISVVHIQLFSAIATKRTSEVFFNRGSTLNLIETAVHAAALRFWSTTPSRRYSWFQGSGMCRTAKMSFSCNHLTATQERSRADAILFPARLLRGGVGSGLGRCRSEFVSCQQRTNESDRLIGRRRFTRRPIIPGLRSKCADS